MPLKRLECLGSCIAFLNDFHNPESRAFQNNNPGLCRAYSFKQLNSVDNEGYRIFSSVIGGWRFIHQDLAWKLSGQTRAKGDHGKLKPTSTLAELLKAFKLADLGNLMQAVDFLKRALKTDEITEKTELKYFLEGE